MTATLASIVGKIAGGFNRSAQRLGESRGFSDLAEEVRFGSAKCGMRARTVEHPEFAVAGYRTAMATSWDAVSRGR